MHSYVTVSSMDQRSDNYDPEPLITTAEAAKLGRVSKMTVTRAVKAGKLTPLRTPGGHFRFRRSDVEALLATEPTEASA